MVAQAHMQELVELCGSAREVAEGLIYFAQLRLPSGCQPAETEALLSLVSYNGYMTRLFLAQPVPGRRTDWTGIYIQGRTWYTWSWNDVSAQLRPAQVLAEHLRALR
jgi:hypothetical protein